MGAIFCRRAPQWSELVLRHRDFFIYHIEPNFGLVESLYANGVLSDKQRADINAENTDYKRNDKLLECIKSREQYDEFIEALRSSDQTHFVNYLEKNGNYAYGDDWPLFDRKQSILQANHRTLIDLLDVQDLLVRLYSSDVINQRQRDFISSKPTSYEKNGALLDILSRRSIRAYKKTIQCLHESNQSHIAQILEEGGVVMRLHAVIPDDRTEDEIICEFASALRNRSTEESLRILEGTLNVIAVKKGESIVLYVYCKTNDEMTNLGELYTSGKLVYVLEKLFIDVLLFKNPKEAVESSSINILQRSQIEQVTTLIDEEDYKKPKDYFELRDTQAILPIDNISPIGKKKKPENRTGHLELETKTVEEQRKIEETEETEGRPMVLLQTITTQAAEDNKEAISGVAIAENELFVTHFKTPVLEVYKMVNFTLSRSWTLVDLVNPCYLVYGRRSQSLYIMDDKYGNEPNKIYRARTNEKLLNSWPTKCTSGSGCLSVTAESNIVVAFREASRVEEYTAHGKIVQDIRFSTEEFPNFRYAIKLSSDKYLISHGEDLNELHRVCMVNVNQEILASFGKEFGVANDRLNAPIVLAMDSSGSIYVVDRGNSRVLLLSSDLQFKRDIISSRCYGMCRPERMAIDESRGLIFLADNEYLWQNRRVLVFKQE